MSFLDKLDVAKAAHSKLPINVIEIAKLMGVRVWNVVVDDDNFSGMIQKSKEDGGSSGYAIYYNRKHSSNRIRFTVAHELGHLCLHEGMIGDGVEDNALYRSGLPSHIEVEANRFAANLLMPMDKLEAAFDEHGLDVDVLANKFAVSKIAMAIRLGLPT